MENAGRPIWKDEAVGTVKNIMMDMWYLDADWDPSASGAGPAFTALASALNAGDFFKGISKGIAAVLQLDGSAACSQQALIISLENSTISMRLVTP